MAGGYGRLGCLVELLGIDGRIGRLEEVTGGLKEQEHSVGEARSLDEWLSSSSASAGLPGINTAGGATVVPGMKTTGGPGSLMLC